MLTSGAYLEICSLLGILILFCVKKYKNISKKRSCWTKNHLKEEVRSMYGAYSTVFRYFKFKDEEEFYCFVGMSVNDFEHLLTLVGPRLQKSSPRKPLAPELKLAAVLK